MNIFCFLRPTILFFSQSHDRQPSVMIISAGACFLVVFFFRLRPATLFPTQLWKRAFFSLNSCWMGERGNRLAFYMHVEWSGRLPLLKQFFKRKKREWSPWLIFRFSWAIRGSQKKKNHYQWRENLTRHPQMNIFFLRPTILFFSWRHDPEPSVMIISAAACFLLFFFKLRQHYFQLSFGSV